MPVMSRILRSMSLCENGEMDTIKNDEIVKDVPKNIKKIEEIGVQNEKEIRPECGNETIVMRPHCDFAGIKLDNHDCPLCKHPIIVYEHENENQ